MKAPKHTLPVRWIRFFYPTLLILFPYLSSAAPDSLQARLFHGIDEIGLSNIFYLDMERNSLWSKIYGSASSLHRHPSGSQGELKSIGALNILVGKALRSNLELRGVFEGDFYKLEKFSGPDPLVPQQNSPPDTWSIINPTASGSLPGQQIERSMIGIGSTFRPDTLMQLTTIIGQQWEQREGFDDRGLSASLDAELDGIEVEGYRNDLSAFIEQEELGARMNRELRFNYGLNKQFSANSSNRLEIYYRQKRYDYHIWGSSSIGTRLDTDQSVRNRLQYNFSTSSGFILDTELLGSSHEDRSTSGNSLREDINTSNALTLKTQRESIASWTRVKFDWGAQEDVTGLKHQRGTSLEGGLSWFPGEMDSVVVSSGVRKRQYDTSDTSNYDDRDRLRYEFDLLYEHEFSPSFRILSRAEVTMEHLVYIFAQKSDQNHWNRVFKLRPEIAFEPHPAWHNTARFELVANSTDYDFELDPAFIKSTIYRRYSAHDSLEWSISRGWALTAEYSIDLEDDGRFLWDDWIQQISAEYRSQRTMLKISRQTYSGIRFDAGFSLYERKGWEHSVLPGGGTMKAPFFYLSRWGPLLTFTFPSASGFNIYASGDLSWVHEWNQEDYTIINLDLRVSFQ